MFGVLRTLGLAFGLLGGAIASQGPEFVQQYAQRLGGAVDELRRVVAVFDADATRSGQTRDAATTRMRSDPDPFIRARGEAASGDAVRLQRLERQRTAFAEAGGPLARLGAIAADPDLDLSRATYLDYRPAIPTTEEGLLTALVGFLVGWGLLRLLTSGVRRVGQMHTGHRSRSVSS